MNFREVGQQEIAVMLKQPKGTHTNIECPYCDNIMIIRDGGHGKFLGCSTFPKCKGKLVFKQYTATRSPMSVLVSGAFDSKNYGYDGEYRDTMEGFNMVEYTVRMICSVVSIVGKKIEE